jgi:hypothetical protein
VGGVCAEHAGDKRFERWDRAANYSNVDFDAGPDGNVYACNYWLVKNVSDCIPNFGCELIKMTNSNFH